MPFSSRLSAIALGIIILQILLDVAVLFNIAGVRQILGVVYLAFVPGIVVVFMSKWHDRDLSEVLVLSVGLSLAVIMFGGLVLNEVSYLIGFSSPLSTLPLLIVMNLVVLLPCSLGFLKDARIKAIDYKILFCGLLLACLPLISVLGAFMVNGYESNSLLLVMILIVSGIVVIGVVSSRFLPVKVYPIALIAITLALLFHQSFMTNYILGYDVHSEYYVYKITETNGYWNWTYRSPDFRIAKGNDMLSVTMLPVIYANILNVEGTWIFKIIFPLLLSFLPVVLYNLYCTQIGEKEAFLAAFFAISLPVFFNLFAAKQMIAELFLGLLLLILLKQRIKRTQKSLLFIAFGAGLVVSHYSTSYLFLFIIVFVWIFQYLLPTLTRKVEKTGAITLSMILLFSVMTFGWYIFTSAAAPFEALVDMGNYVSRNLIADFFSLEARSTPVLRGVGLAEADSIGHLIGRVFFYAAELFILIGFLKCLLKKGEAPFSREYTGFAFFSMIVLATAIVLPNFAASFRMERFFQLALLVLAPYCIYGGKMIFRFLLRRKNDLVALNLVLLVLVSLFMFQSSFIFEVTKDASYSLPLSRYRMDNLTLYETIVDDQEVAGARWILQYTDKSKSTVYADSTAAYHVLTSYGLRSTQDFKVLSNVTAIPSNGVYIYLRRLNVEEGTIVGEWFIYKASADSPMLEDKNKIYSNAGSEIYSSPGDP